MKTLIYITLILFTFVNFSCNNSKSENSLPTIHINKKNIQESTNLDSIIENTKFVALETNDSSLVKEISKVINIGDSILVGDFKLGKILLFSKDGNLISMFKNLGKGPGEYIDITDITYDKKKKEVVLLDYRSGNILRYDLKGKHVGSQQINMPNTGTIFEWFNNSYVFYRHNVAFSDHTNSNIIITNQNQQYINSGATIPEPIKNLSFWGSKNISISDSLLYVHPCFNDTIFSINNKNTIKPSALINIDSRLDIKNSRLWKTKFKDIIQFHEYAKNKNYIYQTSDFISFSDNIIFRYFTKKGYSLVVFSKKNNATKIFNNPTFTKDNFIFNPIGKEKNKIITVIDPADKMDKLNKYLKRPIALNSNPVLCFIELKK